MHGTCSNPVDVNRLILKFLDVLQVDEQTDGQCDFYNYYLKYKYQIFKRSREIYVFSHIVKKRKVSRAWKSHNVPKGKKNAFIF